MTLACNNNSVLADAPGVKSGHHPDADGANDEVAFR